MTTNERDELANLIARRRYAKDARPSVWITGRAALEVADAILAAGYRKPRTITTVEELDALKLPALIDSPNGGPAKVEYYAGPGRQKYVEPLFCDDDGDEESYSLAFFANFGLPATVLHEPEPQP